jgi:chromate transporter
MSSIQPSLFELFKSFFRLGLTAFGGPSMVGYIRKMAVDQKGWLDTEAFNQGVALCQMIPGATAIQTTAFVGLRTRGVAGAAVSFIGFGLPAFLLMMVAAAAYSYAHNLAVVLSAFSGLQAIIVAIIANATLLFGRTSLKSWKHIAIAIVAAAMFGLNVNPIFVIMAAAIGGLILFSSKSKPPTGSPDLSVGQIQSTIKVVVWILCAVAVG